MNGVYDADKANHKAYIKRYYAKYQGMHIVNNNEVRDRIDELLYDDISPENVSGRVKKEFVGVSGVSSDSIRRYVKSIYGSKIQYHRSKLKYKNKSKIKIYKLKDRTNISKRSSIINKRKRFGDTEADFIVSGRAGNGILLVLIDRKTRYVFIRQILKVNINNVHRAFKNIKKEFKEIKTITLDNDILFRRHKDLSKLLNVKIYFCNSYHSWEKGTVENTNKYIRKYIKKRSDISLYTKEYIQTIQDKLNRRPMKCLNYSTPQELFNKYKKKIRTP